MRGDDDEILRAEVMRSVGRCRGDVADDLAEPLGDPTPRVRQAAAEALVGRGKVPRRELRRVFTADRWPMVRAAAVLALASDPGALADEDLVRALRDHSSLVRRAGVNAIGTVRRRSVWRPLVERMEDAQEDALVRAESATALGTVCAQHSAEALTERVRAAVRPMSDPDQRVGAAAIASLVRLGGQRRRQARAFADLPSTPDYLRAAVRVALREPECRDAWRGSGQ
jgi:HEAT repeat protein